MVVTGRFHCAMQNKGRPFCLFSAALACPSDEEYGLSTERLIVQLLVQPVTVPNPTLPLFTSLGVVDLVSSLSDKKKKQGPKCAEELPAAGKRHCPWGKYCRNSTTSRNPGLLGSLEWLLCQVFFRKTLHIFQGKCPISNDEVHTHI